MKYIRLVKDIYHKCETVVRCAAGISEPLAVEVGLHQGSAFNPFLFAIMMDSLSENIRKEAHWQMMFEDDVVLCAMEQLRKMKSMTELAGGELCLPQRPHNQVGAARRRRNSSYR